MNTKEYQNFLVTTDDRGVTTVSLDMPERQLNVCDREMMKELDNIVHDLENAEKTKLVIFRSGKESGFLAGADINAISELQSGSQAVEVIEAGQSLYQRIQWLAMPTVAAIHGPCLGGGLELALACKHRIARDSNSTKLGVPEIMLGLIPAWGGTQRLPRAAGLTGALSMILTGNQLGAPEAYDCGLIDRAARPDHWEEEISKFVDDLLAGRAIESTASRRPWWQRAVEATRIGRAAIFRAAEKRIRSRREFYPALASVLKAVRRGYENRLEGLRCERDEFADLLATPTCRHLLELYFARERARTLSTWASAAATAVHEHPIGKLGVVGAGAMGAGIGQLAAARGYDVTLKEIDEEAAADAHRRISLSIDDLAQRKGWDQVERDVMMNRIKVSHDDVSLVDCDLVIEAVVERDDVKSKVFGMLDSVVQPSAILASNTSSLSVARMATATSRPGQVAGLHFFNPVHRMELVEVVRAVESDEETIACLVAFVKALGKTPIVTTDSPGFLVNRVLFPYLGEAVLMVVEGHDVETIDKQIRRFGMPMGPLELLDQVGIDVALHIANSMQNTIPDVAPVVKQFAGMVEHGYLGTKSGRGYYRYPKGKRTGTAILPDIDANATAPNLAGDYDDDGLTPIQRRLVYPMLSESIKCYDEGVVQESWAIDLGMVLGTGFAPHRGGPLHVVDALGASVVLSNLNELLSDLGDRFTPPQRLIDMTGNGEKFFGELPRQHVASAS